MRQLSLQTPDVPIEFSQLEKLVGTAKKSKRGYAGSQKEDIISAVRIEVTEDCNFRCDYCFGNFGQNTNIKPLSKNSLFSFLENLFLRQNLSDEIVFSFFGGEPLLEFEIVKTAVLKIENLKHDKKIKYSINTNGSLINQEVINFFKKFDFAVMISVDGNEEANKHRKLKSGKPAFRTIEKALSLLLQNNIAYSANLVITPENIQYLPESLDYLISQKKPFLLNFGIADNDSSPIQIRGFNHEEDFKALEYFVIKAIDKMLPHIREQKKFVISPLDKFIVALMIRRDTNFYCSAIRNTSLFLSAKGKIFPCGRYKEAMQTTNVAIETTRFPDYIRLPYEYTDCFRCLIKNFCSGTCIMKKFFLYKSFEINREFDHQMCRFNDLMFRAAAYLISVLNLEELYNITGN